MGGNHLLSYITFLPLLGSLVMFFIPKEQIRSIRYFAMSITVITFIVSLAILPPFNGSTYHFQLLEVHPWAPQYGVYYRMGIDGISLWLVLLTTLLSVVSVWFSFYVDKRVKDYMVFMLILETAMLGTFCALDLILFFTFFEATLIPMLVLIWIWGGERRNYAAIKFFIYTFAGSIFMLVGMIALYQLQKTNSGVASFSLIDIQSNVANGSLWKDAIQLEGLVFWAFAVA